MAQCWIQVLLMGVVASLVTLIVLTSWCKFSLDADQPILIIFGSMTEKTQFPGVHVSPGSVEILVRVGGITNHHLIAYPFSNISAKNYQNRLVCVEVIV